MDPEIESDHKLVIENGVSYVVEALYKVGITANPKEVEEMRRGNVPMRFVDEARKILRNPVTPSFIREHFNVVLR